MTVPPASRTSDATRRQAQILLLALAAVVLMAIFPYITGLLGAGVLYVLCAPLQRRLATMLPRRLSAAVLTLAALIAIALPGAWLVAVIVSEAPGAFQRVQASGVFQRLLEMQIGNLNVGHRLVEAADSLVSWISRQTVSAFGRLTQGTLNLVIALFGLYYLLLSAHEAWAWIRDQLPFSHASADTLRDRFFSITQAMLVGTLVTALLQGSIVGIAFQVVGLPNALFWGVVTGFASVLPVLGSALVWLPGVGVLFFGGRYGAALALALVGLVIASNVDNVIRPIVYRRVSNLHPMTTLVGAFAGVRLFGLIGVLLGPLLISYLFELSRIYRAEYGVGRTRLPPEQPVDQATAPPHELPGTEYEERLLER